MWCACGTIEFRAFGAKTVPVAVPEIFCSHTLTKFRPLPLLIARFIRHRRRSQTSPSVSLRLTGLAAARSPRGSDMPLACHSLPRGRFATPYTGEPYSLVHAKGSLV